MCRIYRQTDQQQTCAYMYRSRGPNAKATTFFAAGTKFLLRALPRIVVESFIRLMVDHGDRFKCNGSRRSTGIGFVECMGNQLVFNLGSILGLSRATEFRA